ELDRLRRSRRLRGRHCNQAVDAVARAGWRGAPRRPYGLRRGSAMMTVSIACDHVDLLGEAPQWHAGEQRLYWVDAFAPAIRSFDPASGALTSYPMARD